MALQIVEQPDEPLTLPRKLVAALDPLLLRNELQPVDKESLADLITAENVKQLHGATLFSPSLDFTRR